MADKKRAKVTPITTPAGIAVFPWLNRPDISLWENGVKVGEDPDKGKYKVGLRLDKDNKEHVAFIDKLKGLFDAAVKTEYAKLVEKAKESGRPVAKEFPKFFDKDGEFREANYPWRDDKEDETKWVVNFSMNAQFKKNKGTKTEETIKIFPGLWTADCKPWPKTKIIGGGSRLIISFVANSYSMANNGAGLSLQLRDVQVLKCETFGGRSAAEAGFQQQEGESYSEENDSPFNPGGEGEGSGDDVPPPNDSDAGPAAPGAKREF